MTAQPSLFDVQTVGAPHNGTLTSFYAAQAAAPKAGTQKAVILDYIVEHGPKTEDELEVGLGYLRSAICARVNSLVHDGLLRDSGERRLTRWNRAAVVWESTLPVSATRSVVALELAGRNGGEATG